MMETPVLSVNMAKYTDCVVKAGGIIRVRMMTGLRYEKAKVV